MGVDGPVNKPTARLGACLEAEGHLLPPPDFSFLSDFALEIILEAFTLPLSVHLWDLLFIFLSYRQGWERQRESGEFPWDATRGQCGSLSVHPFSLQSRSLSKLLILMCFLSFSFVCCCCHAFLPGGVFLSVIPSDGWMTQQAPAAAPVK